MVCEVADAAFVLADIHDIRKNGLGWGNGFALVADVAAAVMPVVPAGAGLLYRSSRAAASLNRLETKLWNQLRHVDGKHLSAVKLELQGVDTGWDHVTEVRDAMNGLRNTIDQLNKILANPNLSMKDRAKAQELLGRASRALDAAEEVFRRYQ